MLNRPTPLLPLDRMGSPFRCHFRLADASWHHKPSLADQGSVACKSQRPKCRDDRENRLESKLEPPLRSPPPPPPPAGPPAASTRQAPPPLPPATNFFAALILAASRRRRFPPPVIPDLR